MPTKSRPKFRPAGREGHSSPRLRLLLISVVLGLIAVTVAALWTGDAVQEAVRDSTTQNLDSLLNANAAALRLWADNQKDLVQRWSRDPGLSTQVRELDAWVRSQRPSRAQLEAHALQPAIRETLSIVLASTDNRGYVIVSRSGTVLSAHDDRIVGAHLSPQGISMIAPVFAGAVVLTKPFRLGTVQLPLDQDPDAHRILVAAPFAAENGEPADAILALATDPEEDFSQILSVARLGATGDTYAFDRNGLMLSDSHVPVERLQHLGLLPARPRVRTVLTLRVCDPGFDLAAHPERNPPAIAERPLTRMAAAAVSGRSGVDVVGYRDYRGVEVFGAWRWLDEYDFGIATEIEVAEAYRVLRPMRIAFRTLLILLVLAIAAILVSYYWILRLRARVADVQELGQYTLLHKIGEGGMGKVYLAKHSMLRRPTAIKLLTEDDPAAMLRFQREVQLTSELNHPNTVAIYDYGRTPTGTFYYAMEYLRGITLRALVDAAGPLPPARVAHLLTQVAGSLEEAHAAGLIHRDIKLENIIVCERGPQTDFVKVLDFGLVKETNRSETDITAPDVLSGTVGYIAPERFVDPTAVDARTDLYALGVVGYQLLTGRTPFTETTPVELAARLMSEEPPSPSTFTDAPVPEPLEQLILDCMARDPELRPASATVVLQRLSAMRLEPLWTQEDARRWWERRPHLLERPWERGGRVGADTTTVTEV